MNPTPIYISKKITKKTSGSKSIFQSYVISYSRVLMCFTIQDEVDVVTYVT